MTFPALFRAYRVSGIRAGLESLWPRWVTLGRRGFRFAQERDQDALAQTAIGHPQRRARPVIHYRSENRAAGQDEIGPIRSDARYGGPIAEISHHDRIGNFRNVVAAKPLTVDPAALVALQTKLNPG